MLSHSNVVYRRTSAMPPLLHTRNRATTCPKGQMCLFYKLRICEHTTVGMWESKLECFVKIDRVYAALRTPTPPSIITQTLRLKRIRDTEMFGRLLGLGQRVVQARPDDAAKLWIRTLDKLFGEPTQIFGEL
jgi:hypothetical protein